MSELIVWNNTAYNPENRKYKKIFECNFSRGLRKDREARDLVIKTLSRSCKGNYCDIDAPIWVGYKITNRCNLSCIHCWAENTSYQPTKENIITAIDKLKEIGVYFIGLSGGELFIREDILDIISYIKEKGMYVELFSNLTLLDEKRISELAEILDSEHDIVQASLDGSNSHTYKLQRKMDCFNQVIINIYELTKRGIKTRISYVATHENVNDLYNTYSLVSSIGVTGFSVSPVYPKNKGKYISNLLDMDKYYDEIYRCLLDRSSTELVYFLPIEFFNRINHMIDKINLPVRNPYILSSGFVSVYINADGRVYPEFELDYEELCYGNIYTDNWEQIRKKIIENNYIAQGRNLENTKCSKCKFLAVCLNHSYEQAYERYKSINKPNPYCKILEVL